MSRRTLNPVRRYRIRRTARELDRLVRARRELLVDALTASDIDVICRALEDRARLYPGTERERRANDVHAIICQAPT